MNRAWFSALGKPLSDEEGSEIAAYLAGLGIDAPISTVESWQEARELCRQRSDRWWDAEEAERLRLEQGAHLDPADREWLALNEALRSAATGASGDHPFARKYALVCAGRWPLGVYDGRFRIF